MRTSAKSVGEGRSRRSNVAGGLWLPFRVARVAVLDCCTADSLTGCLVPGRLNTYVLDDGEADRQLVFTAARRFCPAVVTPPMAATTPDTVLASRCAARSLTDVLSLVSAEVSALVWAWYWPRASVTNVARAVLTSLRSAVISLTMPVPTLTCLRLSSEARKAAASAHRTEFDGEAAEEAVVDDEDAVEDVLPEVPLPDPHPAVSSARPHTTMTIFHRAALVTMPGFIPPRGCHAARHLSLTLGGLSPAPGPPGDTAGIVTKRRSILHDHMGDTRLDSRGMPQHAFQVCGYAFAAVQEGL